MRVVFRGRVCGCVIEFCRDSHSLMESCGLSPFSCYDQEIWVSLLNFQSCRCCSQKQSCSVYHRLVHVGQCFHRRWSWRPLSRGKRGRFCLLGDHAAMALVCWFQSKTKKAKRTITNDVYEDMRGTLRRWGCGLPERASRLKPRRRCMHSDAESQHASVFHLLQRRSVRSTTCSGRLDMRPGACERLFTPLNTQTYCLPPVLHVFLLYLYCTIPFLIFYFSREIVVIFVFVHLSERHTR